jgi:transmembrane sensor
MGKLAEEVAFASEELAPAWDEERSARLLSGIRVRQRRRGQAQRTASVLAATLVLVIGGIWITGQGAVQQDAGGESAALDSQLGSQPLQQADSRAPATLRDGHTIRLLDGSRAQLAGEQSELAIVRNDPKRVGLRLLKGRAHFDVVPNAQRSFEVEAAPYRVVVLGTVFDVERTEGHVSVSVQRGRVRVYGPQGAEDLLPGQYKRFDARASDDTASLPSSTIDAPEELAPMPVVDGPIDGAPVERARGARRAAHGSSDRPSWRSLTQSGDYDAAFESLRGSAEVQNDPAELMDAADAARLSGHPDAAVSYLERVVKGHRKSPVAPLAAFTLGRVYLDRLGQPHKAAEAFELARRLSPAGSLAQDALAREVEALSKGGNAQKAYLRASEYMHAYPNGRRLRAVQLYGGME